MRFVTTHAVLRYLERVLLLGPEIDARVPRLCSERRRVEAGCEILGATIDEIADLICPPRLHRAMEMGPRAIVAAGYRMPVRDGVAVTVLTDGMQ